MLDGVNREQGEGEPGRGWLLCAKSLSFCPSSRLLNGKRFLTGFMSSQFSEALCVNLDKRPNGISDLGIHKSGQSACRSVIYCVITPSQENGETRSSVSSCGRSKPSPM